MTTQASDGLVERGIERRPYRVAYLVTHPIQYQAPLLRLIARQPDIELTVFFSSDLSLRAYEDPGFGRAVTWDVSLVDGYRHEFLPALGRTDIITALRPFTYGFRSRLRKSRFDALWVHGYARPSNLIAIVVARLAGLKVLVRDEANEMSAARSPLRRAAKGLFFRLLSLWVDGFLAIGSLNRAYYIRNGVRPDRVFMMPYAVDNAFFADRARRAADRRDEMRQALGLSPGRPIILFASKFSARKRPDDLLEAYERLIAEMGPEDRRPYLLYVGDGEMRVALEHRAAQKGLRDVRFLGFRNQTELPAFFDLCDVFVLVSSHEPWGLVVNEAMASGRAVVVGDGVGCAADIVKSNVNGFVVRPGDIAGLANALREALSSPDRSRAMGEASRAIIDGWSFREDIAGLREALAAGGSLCTK